MPSKFNSLPAYLPLLLTILVTSVLMFYVFPPSFVMRKAFEPYSLTAVFSITDLSSVIVSVCKVFRSRLKGRKKLCFMVFLIYLLVDLVLIFTSAVAIESYNQTYVPMSNIPWIAVLAFSGILVVSSLVFCAGWWFISRINLGSEHVGKQVFVVSIVIVFLSALYSSGFTGTHPPVFFHMGADMYEGKPLSEIFGNTITTRIPIFHDATFVSMDVLRINNSDFVEHKICISGDTSEQITQFIQFLEINITIWERTQVLFRIEERIAKSAGEVSVPPGEWVICLIVVGTHFSEPNRTIDINMWVAVE